MYRLTYESGKWHGLKIGTIKRDEPHIKEFTDMGEVVILVKYLENLAQIGINVEDVVF